MAWFVQAKVTLRNAGIILQITKPDFISKKLDLDALETIQNLLFADLQLKNLFDQVKAC